LVFSNPGEGNLNRLGSDRSSTLVDRTYLQGCTFISVDLEEDASFNVEFIYHGIAKVVVLDPTQKTVEHFNNWIATAGRPKSREYLPSGDQLVDSYDSSKASAENLSLVKKALWKNSERIKFFSPNEHNHSSHSMTNIQHIKNFIVVEAAKFSQLVNDLQINPKDPKKPHNGY
jgi:hypothetical protein